MKLNVSQLTCAVLDEGWRARWLAGENPSTRHFAPPGEATVHGVLFHRLADKMVSWLQAAPDAARLDTESLLWDAYYTRFGGAELARLVARDPEGALALSERMRAFCRQLVSLRSRSSAFSSWSDVFVASEYPTGAIEFKHPRGVVRLNGRPDAIRLHPSHQLEIVDYKLSRGTNQKHDMVQLAIYAALLARAKPGLDFCGTLEYYVPALQPLEVSPQDLREIFESVVWPVVSELFPPTERSASPAATTTAGRRDRNPQREIDSGLDGAGVEIERCFSAFGLKVKVTGRQEAPQIIRYAVRPAPGVKVVSLSNRAEDLQVALRLAQPPLVTTGPGHVNIDVPRPSPAPVRWSEVIRNKAFTSHPGSLCFPVGVGVDGRVVIADLGDSGTAHALVAGSSGSGKSFFLRSVVASLLDRNPPSMLRLSIVDPKFLTFSALGVGRLTGPVINDVSGALACLEAAAADMDARYRTLNQEGRQTLGQRLADGITDLPYHVIVFDEFAELVLAGKDTKKNFEALVARIAAKGRAAGIHLILATQRPDRTIVTGLIKANLPLRVCLRVTNLANSQIVLDQGGADALLGRGDLLCDLGRGLVRAQSPLVTDEELRAVSC